MLARVGVITKGSSSSFATARAVSDAARRVGRFTTTGAHDCREGMRFGKFNKTINFRFAAFPSKGFNHRGEAKGRELCLPDGG